MSQFHSNVSRRDFMKGLGLAGVGAAALTAPVLHDLDELTSSADAKRPWWIKNVDEPTVEIDWSLVKPPAAEFEYVVPTAQATDLAAKQLAFRKDQAQKKAPGNTLRDGLLGSASVVTISGPTTIQKFSDLGMPRYEGTPEDNLKMTNAAFKLWGIAQVGVLDMTTPHARQMMYDGPRATARKFKWGDVADIVQTATEYTIPNKASYLVEYLAQSPIQLQERAPSALGWSGNTLASNDLNVARQRYLMFLYGLGYYTLNIAGSLGPGPGFAILNGLSEHHRMSGTTLSPEYGPTNQGPDNLLVELPLAPTKPVDAGVLNFCDTCKKCAETCPSKSLSFEGRSWDMPTQYNRIGFNGYRRDPVGCLPTRLYSYAYNTCSICKGTCTFSKEYLSNVHAVVAATLSTTTLFNGFFAQMDRKFGYGTLSDDEQEKFWDLDLPLSRYKK